MGNCVTVTVGGTSSEPASQQPSTVQIGNTTTEEEEEEEEDEGCGCGCMEKLLSCL